jgi:hypothetical protein
MKDSPKVGVIYILEHSITLHKMHVSILETLFLRCHNRGVLHKHISLGVLCRCCGLQTTPQCWLQNAVCMPYGLGIWVCRSCTVVPCTLLQLPVAPEECVCKQTLEITAVGKVLHSTIHLLSLFLCRYRSPHALPAFSMICSRNYLSTNNQQSEL